MLHSVDKAITTAFREYILSYCQANCLSLFLTFWLSDILRVRIFAWRQVSKGGASPKFFYAFWLKSEKVKYFAFVCWPSGFSIFL